MRRNYPIRHACVVLHRRGNFASKARFCRPLPPCPHSFRPPSSISTPQGCPQWPTHSHWDCSPIPCQGEQNDCISVQQVCAPFRCIVFLFWLMGQITDALWNNRCVVDSTWSTQPVLCQSCQETVGFSQTHPSDICHSCNINIINHVHVLEEGWYEVCGQDMRWKWHWQQCWCLSLISKVKLYESF